ncbi:MAG TPA: FHA domain-containing protein [Chloroflexota bacterium]|nr:FHA domain-containing protein [Chloroflexota bacterium]
MVSDDALILALRMAVVVVLYAFLLTLVVLTQRELYREASARSTSAPGARLVVVEPGATAQAPGHTIPLDAVTRLGRSADNTIVLDDDYVSAAHAIVLLHGGRWWVRDAGSTNGTIVNGSRIDGETALSEGDTLQIGQVVFRLAS